MSSVSFCTDFILTESEVFGLFEQCSAEQHEFLKMEASAGRFEFKRPTVGVSESSE